MLHLQRSLFAIAPFVMLAAGCNVFFKEADSDAPRVDTAPRTDAPDSNARINLPFVNVENTNIVGADSGISPEGLELTLVGYQQPYQIYQTTRATRAAEFSVPQVLSINSPQNDIEPAITADQRLLIFASDRKDNGYELFQATRATARDAFANLMALNRTFADFKGFDASPDGLKVFYVDDGFLQTLTRPTIMDNFVLGPKFRLSDPSVRYPTVSFDGQELVYSANNQLERALFDAQSNQFGAPQPLSFGSGATLCPNATDPDFSPDAMALTFSCNDGTIRIASRVAP